MALRWILDFDAVSTIIPGATNPSQAAMNSVASELPLVGAKLHDWLRTFYEAELARHIRGPY